jgi:ketosteroid isomerase-like protein
MTTKIVFGMAALGCALLPFLFGQIIEKPDLKRDRTEADKIFRLEDAAMEQWRQGNPLKWVEISAEDITYLDPDLAAPIVGKKAYAEYLGRLKGKIFYDASEYVAPRVALYGDLAVLTYNYHSLRKDPNGRLQRTSFWNTTEIYRRIAGEWKIVHTHWSHIKSSLPESLELKLPILTKAAKPPAEDAAEILKLETKAMERWRKGDPNGFLELSWPEITYFDTGTPARLEHEALKAEYGRRVGKIHYDVMDFVSPRFYMYGDTAVLFYQFLSTTLNPDGSIQSRTPWNCTEVFVKKAGVWKIAHTHWSFINGKRKDGGI